MGVIFGGYLLHVKKLDINLVRFPLHENIIKVKNQKKKKKNNDF